MISSPDGPLGQVFRENVSGVDAVPLVPAD
jgi:hypothetical protein